MSAPAIEIQVTAGLVDAVEILGISKGEKLASSVTQGLIRLALCGCGYGKGGDNGQNECWPHGDKMEVYWSGGKKLGRGLALDRKIKKGLSLREAR